MTLPQDTRIVTHEAYEAHRQKYADLYGPHGWLLFVACDAGQELAHRVRDEYYRSLEEAYREAGNDAKIVEIPLMAGITNKFEGDGRDGTCPRIPHHVGGADAYVFQNVMDKRRGSKSVNDNLMQLGQMIATLKAHGAAKVTAIVPYFPYSRQDKPSYMKREAALVRAVADYLVESKVDQVASYHPHTTGIVGIFPFDKPFRYISGLDLFVNAFSRFKGDQQAISFCTDAGGIKENIHLADALGIDFGLAAKHRPKQKTTKALGIVADMTNKKRAIVIDDEAATFGSCFDVAKHLAEDYGIEEIYVGVSHMRVEQSALPKLVDVHEKYNVKEIHTTDSVPPIEELYQLPFVKVHSLARMWATVINRLHYDMSVSKLFYDPERNHREKG